MNRVQNKQTKYKGSIDLNIPNEILPQLRKKIN